MIEVILNKNFYLFFFCDIIIVGDDSNGRGNGF